MDDSQRAWELAIALIASGKIAFDPANPQGSVKCLFTQLKVLKEALEAQTAPATVHCSCESEKDQVL
ncbi:hypothetical protein D3C76_791380 [compost metagenome]|uniref:Uncharacterized protein n=1 Tax=Pseudomonas fluorescens TaxID=294 RepID=A0A5E6WK55_PSEFL|nr:hypothetical protein [Pseudomonas fluorescens]VVN28411.1 hypothetical protein PS659_04747 [Pseudomonas fluorescens]